MIEYMKPEKRSEYERFFYHHGIMKKDIAKESGKDVSAITHFFKCRLNSEDIERTIVMMAKDREKELEGTTELFFKVG